MYCPACRIELQLAFGFFMHSSSSDSTGALHVLQSLMKINTHETPLGAKIVGTFCLCLFLHVIFTKIRIPSWSSMADDVIAQGGIPR